MFIGELAKKVGLSPKAIRFYEDSGLLSGPDRSEAGYRVYSAQDVERLRFVRGAKALGFSLKEIKELLALWAGGARPCGTVSRLLESKLVQLDRRIAELQIFRDELRAYKTQVDQSAQGDEAPCAHIEGAAAGRWAPSVPQPAEKLHP